MPNIPRAMTASDTLELELGNKIDLFPGLRPAERAVLLREVRGTVKIAKPIHEPHERREGYREVHHRDPHRLFDRRVESSSRCSAHRIDRSRMREH